MTVLIRPSLDVFRGTTPLLVVFGAYLAPTDADGPGTEGAALSALVAEARRYRVVLAFCRPPSPPGGATTGAWRRSCRPTIRDVVIELDDGSCFGNPEFERAIGLRGWPEVVLCGPSDDSNFNKSVAEGLVRGIRMSVVDLGAAMRHGSTPATATRAGAANEAVAEAGRLGYLVGTGAWLERLRSTSTTEETGRA